MIDVLLPFYGDPELMRRAVQSVREQTYQDWRLVVVDDHHPDTTLGAWLTSLADPRIVHERNAATRGVNGNFARCLELSSADWITFMGCDDLMLPGHLAAMAEAIRRHPDAGMVQPRVEVIDADGNPARPLVDRVKGWLGPQQRGDVVLDGEDLAARLMIGNWLYFPAIAWRREEVLRHGFRTGLETALDLDLLLRLTLDGASLVLVDAETFAYRRHTSSASSVTARSTARFREEHIVCAEFAGRCRERGWRRAARAGAWRSTSRAHALVQAAHAGRSGEGRLALDLLGLATRRSA